MLLRDSYSITKACNRRVHNRLQRRGTQAAEVVNIDSGRRTDADNHNLVRDIISARWVIHCGANIPLRNEIWIAARVIQGTYRVGRAR